MFGVRRAWGLMISLGALLGAPFGCSEDDGDAASGGRAGAAASGATRGGGGKGGSAATSGGSAGSGTLGGGGSSGGDGSVSSGGSGGSAGAAASGGALGSSGASGSGGAAGSSGSAGKAGTSGSGGAAGAAGSSGSSGSAGAAGTNSDIPGGGTILFQERFDNASLAARGWYDGPGGTISTTEHSPGSTSSFECAFAQAATGCSAGKPGRHAFTATDRVYLAFDIKFSQGWVGSGRPYHPHMFHFLTDQDPDFVGPAHTFLTTYTEMVGNRALLALQDSKNVDLNCIIRNNDTFVGCNGNSSTYPFTENRSVCSCNGLVGDLDGRDCFDTGNGTWYSSRSWGANGAFTDTAGPRYESDWHRVEVYFQMNTIQAGKGVPDGKIRWVQDGQTLISYDRILMRTATRAAMRFDQFAMLPYIGDGSPIAQRFWVDELVVATARP